MQHSQHGCRHRSFRRSSSSSSNRQCPCRVLGLHMVWAGHILRICRVLCNAVATMMCAHVTILLLPEPQHSMKTAQLTNENRLRLMVRPLQPHRKQLTEHTLTACTARRSLRKLLVESVPGRCCLRQADLRSVARALMPLESRDPWTHLSCERRARRRLWMLDFYSNWTAKELESS